MQIKKLIWEYAGVQSGGVWKVISSAAINAEFPIKGFAGSIPEEKRGVFLSAEENSGGPTSSPAVGKQHIDSEPVCQCGIS